MLVLSSFCMISISAWFLHSPSSHTHAVGTTTEIPIRLRYMLAVVATEQPACTRTYLKKTTSLLFEVILWPYVVRTYV